MSTPASAIARVELFSYELTYIGGTYVMSGGREITSLSSTVVRVETRDGVVGWGETCPLGSNYLPAHAAGARAALAEVAPRVLGLDAANPVQVSARMDAVLLGHEYAKSALDVACWDAFGRAIGRPVYDLIGGLQQPDFPLYVAIPLGEPETMAAYVRELQGEGIRRFQLKLGDDPVADAARSRAVVEVADPGDVVVGDANGGWSVRDAVIAARLLDGLAGFQLEQPCRTMEECLQVRERTTLPLILDEVIVDVASLLRAWEARALEGFNLKINRVGGLTKAKLLRDVGQSLGLVVNIEDSWGGDVTTAAVSHLAASTPAATTEMVSFMNDWVNEHVAGHQPRSVGGRGAPMPGSGLGLDVDVDALGRPFATYA